LPQLQIIRYVLDNNGMALTAKDTELSDILESPKEELSLVITNSRMFKKVNEIVTSVLRLNFVHT
jgi:hypothetical protein